MASGCDAVPLAVVLHQRQELPVGLAAFQMLHQVIQPDDAGNRDAEILFQFLNGRQAPGAALLPVERQYDPGGLPARLLDQRDGLPNRGAGGDDVVDNQDAARYRRADDGSAFAVVLDLLAIEAKGRSRPWCSASAAAVSDTRGMPL